MNNSDMTPAMASTIRVLNLLTSSAGFDASKVIQYTPVQYSTVQYNISRLGLSGACCSFF